MTDKIISVDVRDFYLDGNTPIIALDAISPLGFRPHYRVRGKVNCIECEDWCWLGEQTYAAVMAMEAAPVCLACARKMVAPGTPPLRNIKDD